MVDRPADDPPGGSRRADGGSRLYGPSFLMLCGIALAAYAGQMMIQPVLPLLVLDLGGDSTLAGLVVFAFSLPSVLIRPLFGRLSDRRGPLRVLGIGVGGITLSGVAYLVPTLVMVFLVRIGHGIAWAAYNTGAGSLLAELAPAHRRGEAAGVYSLMQGLANVLMPAAGLVLATTLGLRAPFALVALLGLVALFGVWGIRRDRGPSPLRARTEEAPGRLVERTALLPMAIDLVWLTAYPLFFVFPPVVASLRGIALADLWVYYVVAGSTLVTCRFLASRVLDRYARRTSLLAGCALGSAALAIGIAPLGLVGLTVAGALYAAGMSVIGPTVIALAIDRAPADRTGAAIATQSLGGQLGIGIGSLAAGALLDVLPTEATFVTLLAVIVVLAAQVARRLPRSVDGTVVPGDG